MASRFPGPEDPNPGVPPGRGESAIPIPPLKWGAKVRRPAGAPLPDTPTYKSGILFSSVSSHLFSVSSVDFFAFFYLLH